MTDYQVQLIFADGINSYTFPLVQALRDPNPGMKATVIKGNRASGSIVIPGGQESIEIRVKGYLVDNDGYEDLTDKINEMKTKVSTNPATLTLRHWTGSTWQTDWQYSVRRISEIDFPDSFRTSSQEYNVNFLVLSY